jgi:hypothetical protein
VGTTVPEEYVIFCGTVANIRLRLVGASLLGARSSACPSAPVEPSARLAGRCEIATTLAEHAVRRTTRIIPAADGSEVPVFGGGAVVRERAAER